MSIKKIILFVLLLLTAYCGVYITIYGFINYSLYSTAERSFDNRENSELQSNLNIKGSIDTVTHLIYSETVTKNILSFKVVTDNTRYYYLVPLGYSEEPIEQKYCAIAVYEPEDVEAVKKLMKEDPVPFDPNASLFEFRAIAMDMDIKIRSNISNYLLDKFSQDYPFYIGVKNNIVPYTIFVKGSDNNENLLLPIIAGGSVAVISITLVILLAVRTYKRKHMYD